VDAYAFSPDRTTLHFITFEPYKPRELFALDTRSLDLLWHEPLKDIAARSRIGEVRIDGAYRLVVSADGGKLALDGDLAPAWTDVLVIIDANSRSPVGFVQLAGGWRSWTGRWQSTVTLGPDPSNPSGSVLVPARTTSDIFLYFMDGSTFEVQDSLLLNRRDVNQLLPAPDRRHVYVVGADSLYKVDRLARRIVARAWKPNPYGRARLAIAPDGETLYMTDPGDGRNFPGSGLLFVMGPNFEPRTPIDLGALPSPIVTHSAAVSGDGSLVYVTYGTPYGGPLYGFQPSRLLVIDARAGRLIRYVPFNDWNVRQVFAYRVRRP
jgi:hypothetical protein